MSNGRSRRRLSLRAMAANIVTVLALSAGLTSIRFALDGRWEAAVFAIVIAGLLDGIDGSIARLLKSSSRFGAELDSLADVVSFGVAPAVILYQWSLRSMGGQGWVLALALVICCALRLARYNAKLDEEDQPRKKAGFLTGVPAPMGAGVSLLPLMIFFETEIEFFRSPELVGTLAALVALGMVSRIATFSWRQFSIERQHMVPLLALVGVTVALMTAYGWSVWIVIGILYLISLPTSMYRYYRIRKAEAAGPPQTGD